MANPNSRNYLDIKKHEYREATCYLFDHDGFIYHLTDYWHCLSIALELGYTWFNLIDSRGAVMNNNIRSELQQLGVLYPDC